MSQVGLLKKYNNVIITRTLSKAYGLAGLRFGYALGAKEVIDQISGSLLPWNVGTIPMWTALGSLRRYRSAGGTRQVQQRGSGLHHRIAERHPRLRHLPIQIELYPHGLRQNRERRAKKRLPLPRPRASSCARKPKNTAATAGSASPSARRKRTVCSWI
jgi:hypothetical protein